MFQFFLLRQNFLDALATAVYVKGVKGGIDFIDQLPQTHAIIIDDRNKIYFSKDLQYEQE